MSSSFYSKRELKKLCFKNVGNDVLISRKASFYGIEQITIGNNVRIDDFCILSGDILLGSNIHISAYTALYGSYGITLEDYTGLSPRVLIFSAIDDFSGDFLIGSVHAADKTQLSSGLVTLKKFSQVGAGSIIFPGITIQTGTIVGAMSLVKESLEEWGIYAGIPAKKIKNRNKNLLNYI